MEESKKKSRRGFASLTKERMREVARMGGKASQAQGTGHRFTSENASAAGRKGGQAVARDRAHMERIGRLGGKRRAEKAREKEGE